MRKISVAFAICVLVAQSISIVRAETASTASRLPVREITVFKDGHSYVLHEGPMPADSHGNVVLDYLPNPVLGTFWPYSADDRVKLSSVVAGQRKVATQQTSLQLAEMIRSNVGASVTVTETTGNPYEAHISGIPERAAATEPGTDRTGPAIQSEVVLLRSQNGLMAVPLNRIRKLIFHDNYKPGRSVEEIRNVLTMKLDWSGGVPGNSARVGMVYVQKGIRWIPSYRISIDGLGNAKVKLQATIVNEMTDLKDVTANLVIGIPSFAFKDTPDPISLQQQFAQLSPLFETGVRSNYALSNGIMTQAIGGQGVGGGFGGGGRGAAQGAADANASGPEVAGSGKTEDLFVFTVKHISLAKGERMVIPVTEYALKYKNIYTLGLPVTPPQEGQSNINSDQQLEIARLLNAPKVRHKIRLENLSSQPFTTAPALLLNGDKVVSQSMMMYTPVLGHMDLDLATAIDIGVKKKDKETARDSSAGSWQGTRYARIDLSGTVKLTNSKAEPVEVEVTRYALGNADKVSEGGAMEQVDPFDDSASYTFERPTWWRYYSWPYWWHHLNGIGKFSWTVKLAAGQSEEVTYAWHYFW